MAENQPILLQHGWGFDKSIWDNWISMNPQYRFVTADRGYYGRPFKVDYSKVTMAVTHSFGLHLLPKNLFAQLNKLVIISGFQEFHPLTENQRVFSQRVVRQMINKIATVPNVVLDKFIKNCFLPNLVDYREYGEVNIPLLQQDLNLLHTQRLNEELLLLPDAVVILHGNNDAIVHSQKATELHNTIPGSRIMTRDKGGHMLPVIETQWCLNQIKTLF